MLFLNGWVKNNFFPLNTIYFIFKQQRIFGTAVNMYVRLNNYEITSNNAIKSTVISVLMHIYTHKERERARVYHTHIHGLSLYNTQTVAKTPESQKLLVFFGCF